MRDPQEKKLTTRKQNMAYLRGSKSQQQDSGEISDIEPGPPRSRIKTF